MSGTLRRPYHTWVKKPHMVFLGSVATPGTAAVIDVYFYAQIPDLFFRWGGPLAHCTLCGAAQGDVDWHRAFTGQQQRDIMRQAYQLAQIAGYC